MLNIRKLLALTVSVLASISVYAKHIDQPSALQMASECWGVSTLTIPSASNISQLTFGVRRH